MEGREYNMDNQEESLGFRSTIRNLIVTGFFRSVYSTSSQRGQEEMGWETTVCDGSSEHLEYSLTIKKKKLKIVASVQMPLQKDQLALRRLIISVK